MRGGSHQLVRGFALTEFLAAFLVFSLSLAGALTVQLEAWNASRETLLRKDAMRLLEAIIAAPPALVPAQAPVQDLRSVLAQVSPAAQIPEPVWAAAALDRATVCVASQGAVARVTIAWGEEEGEDGAGAACDEKGRHLRLMYVRL